MAQVELSDIDDEILVRAVAQGDGRAFAVIFIRNRRAVTQVCRRYLRDPSDVEDAVQETFLKAYRALPVMECRNLVGWLSRIAQHVCIDLIRHDAKRPVSMPILEDVDAGLECGPEDTVAGGDPKIDLVLMRLPSEHRAAVQLRFMDDLSHQEIAAAMRKSVGQVKALVHRAKARLRAEWALA